MHRDGVLAAFLKCNGQGIQIGFADNLLQRAGADVLMHFFTDPDELYPYKGTLMRLLAPVANKACKGEFTAEDLWELALERKIFVGLMDDPEMAVAFEFRHYPRFMAINIVALGGRDLQRFMKEALPRFRSWAAMTGAKRIEASCNDAIARMLTYAGFEKDYVQVSIPVEETC
jgi:hypothetical protein